MNTCHDDVCNRPILVKNKFGVEILVEWDSNQHQWYLVSMAPYGVIYWTLVEDKKSWEYHHFPRYKPSWKIVYFDTLMDAMTEAHEVEPFN